MDPILIGRAIVAFLGGIRATVFFVLLLLAIAGGKFWQHKAEGYKADLQKSEAARAAAIAIWKNEIDRLTRDLASAKEAGEKAIADKAASEAAAKKRLAAREKEWRRIYGSKPENKAWADQVIPPDVLDFLNDEAVPCVKPGKKVGSNIATLDPC